MNSILSYIFLIILLLSGCKEQEKNATNVQTPATHTDSYALIKSWGEYVRKGEYEILIDTAKTYYRKAIANHDKKTQAYVGAYIGQAYILSGQAASMFTYFNAAIPGSCRETLRQDVHIIRPRSQRQQDRRAKERQVIR